MLSNFAPFALTALAALAALSLSAVGAHAFSAAVTKATAFGTGHLFDLGSCAAVTTRIGAGCFESMPDRITPYLSDALAANVSCVTHLQTSPCAFGSIKYSVRSAGYDCDALHLLFADANEECLRKYADARFWACLGYLLALSTGIGILCSLTGMLPASGRA